MTQEKDDLIFRLNERARIRRQISSRRSVQEGKPDRLADLLEEAAREIRELEDENVRLGKIVDSVLYGN